MSGITDYKVLSAVDPAMLAAQVTAAIADGWQPVIGPAVLFEGRLLKEVTKGSTILVGEAGTNGTNGADGTTFTFGSGAPDDGDGANGDTYLDCDEPRIYLKAAGTWGAGTAINIGL